MPIDHTSLPVPLSKVDEEVAWFVAAFGHMGLKELMRPVAGVVGIGEECGPYLWISGYDADFKPIPDGAQIYRTHLALVARDRAQVDTFHAVALKAGGIDNGKPGVRAEYHPNYYCAFALSPAGHNLEAVVHAGPEAAK